MNNQLTDLLPQERQHALRRDYYLNLYVVAALLVIALIAAASVLLFPSYVFLITNENTLKNRLSVVQSTLASTDGKGITEEIAALSADSAELIAMGHNPAASATIRDILAISHPGVALTGFSYTSYAGAAGSLGTIVISGIATTRNALRGYQIALQGSPKIRSAELPVSAYAKDSGIEFSINVTLSP